MNRDEGEGPERRSCSRNPLKGCVSDEMFTVNVSIPTDEAGLLGRECPVSDCLGYFKVKPGTGIPR
jgi:hypothetical protein